MHSVVAQDKELILKTTGTQGLFSSRERQAQKLCFENSHFGCYVENNKEGKSPNGETREEAAAVIYMPGVFGVYKDMAANQLQEVEDKEAEK